MSQFLVTGGAGFIASHLVDKLVELGHQVVVIDDFSLGKEANLEKSKDKITLYRKSITEDLVEIFQKHKFHGIFHIAALPRVQFSIAEPIKTHEANVNGTLNLLNTARKHGVKRFVFSSSSSIYGDQEKLPVEETLSPNTMSPYALHKLIGEQYCNLFGTLYGMETISLRYFNVYGIRQDPLGGYACLIPKFAKKLIDSEVPTIYGDGEQTRDFTHVSDVVEANLAAFNTTNTQAFGDYFNIGSGKSYSVNSVTRQIKEILESDIEAQHGAPVIEPKHTRADISKAKAILGWQPQVAFEHGLKETVEALK